MAKMFIIWTMVCLLPGCRQEIHMKAFQTNMEEGERDTEQGDSNQLIPKRQASSVSWRWFGFGSQSHKMPKILGVKGSKSFIFPSIDRVTSLWSACRHLSIWPCHPAVTQSPGTCRLATFLLLFMCVCVCVHRIDASGSETRLLLPSTIKYDCECSLGPSLSVSNAAFMNYLTFGNRRWEQS